MRTLLLASALIAALFGSSASAPVTDPAAGRYHAFCRTVWLFTMPCDEVRLTLLVQVQAYNPLIGCEECQYALVSASPLFIKANHTSPDGLQAETITFAFNPTVENGGCRVSAQSTSLGFTGLLDGGLNYCNLYKLLSASGLNSSPGFMETINEWACMGYGLNTCKA